MELIKATAQTHHIDIGQKEFKGIERFSNICYPNMSQIYYKYK